MVIEFNRQKHKTLTCRQVRDFDSRAINDFKISGVVLMENAGRGASEVISGYLEAQQGRKAAIFCGTGNNGGDGFVIARHLYNLGFEPKIILCGNEEKIKNDALANYIIARKMSLDISIVNPQQPSFLCDIKLLLDNCDIAVDALFGTGLNSPLRSGYAEIVRCLNACEKTVIAIDIPSGLDCDTGLPLALAVKADATITFAAAKKGFEAPASKAYTGKIFIASIGIEPKV